MRIFDAHAHLAGERFREDFPEVLARMRENQVEFCMLVTDPAEEESDLERACALSGELGFPLAVGVHPHNAKAYSPEIEKTLAQCVRQGGVCCLGEIGLDYHYDLSPRETQRQVLQRQLDLALEWNLPVQFHIREAHGDAMEILAERRREGRLPRGVMHCFSGSWETAKFYLHLGLYLSLSGTVTFKNAAKLLEVAKNVPADRLFVETDCPYMAPEPMRGRRNEPAFVRYTFERVAALREEDPEALARRLRENFRELYGY